MGIRVLDLRITGYIDNLRGTKGKDKYQCMEFWCSHTFLSVPLLTVLMDIMRFSNENPSEVIIIKIKPEGGPLNADNWILPATANSEIVALQGRDNKDLVKQVVNLLGDKIVYNFDPSMTVNDITQKLKKNFVIFF